MEAYRFILLVTFFAMVISMYPSVIVLAAPAKSQDPVEKQIDKLLKKMTIEEKAGQLNQSGFGPYEKYIKSKTGLGHLVMQWGGGTTSAQAIAEINRLQKIAVEETRLGIPLLVGCDGIYDARVADSVTFPQQISMGSTWNPALIQKAYSVMSSELRSVGYGRTYAPNVGVARDPRFGRTGECYSEDTFLSTQMGVAAVKGLKGDSLRTGVMATLKHYAAHDAGIGGKDSSGIDLSDRALREVWLPPFYEAIKAGAGSIMCAYHAVNGVPCVANKYLLTDILKKEWGFDGFVVTDFVCIESLFNSQHVTETFDDAIKMAFEAGLDVHDHDMGDDFASTLAALVRKGTLSEKVINEAVRRVLRAKFRLGLFDNPYIDPQKAVGLVGSKEHIALSLQTARESIVLLKNSGDALPLSKNLSSIAVIGPNADNLTNQCGVWTKDPKGYTDRMVTLLQGIKHAVSPATQINYAKGCAVSFGSQSTTEIPVQTAGAQTGWQADYYNNVDLSGQPVLSRVDPKIQFDWGNGSPAPEVNPDYFSARWTAKYTASASGTYKFSATVDDGVRLFVDDNLVMDAWPDHVGTTTASVDMEAGKQYNLRVEYHETTGGANIQLAIESPLSGDAGIAEAVAAAKKSEVAIVVVGDSPELNAEAHDRADLDLTGDQQRLVEAVYKTGTPTIVVMVNARPLTINYIVKNLPAIVEAWNPGEQGGTAVAEVLFGDYNPGGKLPITFPCSVGQLPVFYNQEPGWHGGTYADGTPSTPLYPFGYGLSYTKFQYSNLKLSQPALPADGSVKVSVTVRNVGERAGDEVVQLYIHDPVASVVRPVKELKGFQRVSLAAGAKKTVSFELAADDLAFYNRDMKRVVEPGTIQVMVGGSSVDLQTVILTVKPQQ